MELQWPLIIFTSFVAWAAGLFATQCIVALKGACPKAQMPAWVTSAALLVIGGIAVFFHLEHWERIFNGFGHLTSGITQELIAIVVLAVVAVVFLVLWRRDGKVPSWLCGVGIAVSVLLVAVMAHSYVMPARPAWDTPLWIIYVLGNACVLGPVTMIAIIRLIAKEEVPSFLGVVALGGAALNVIGAAAYTVAMIAAGGSFSSVGYYYDPLHPTYDHIDVSSLTPLAGDSVMLLVVGALIIGALVPLACTLVMRKKGNLSGTLAVVAIVAAVVGAICMRVVFYQMGSSIFLLF